MNDRMPVALKFPLNVFCLTLRGNFRATGNFAYYYFGYRI